MVSTAGQITGPAEDAAGPGLPSEQVRAWIECVLHDLDRVRARLVYLQLEERRLAEQHQLLAQLLVSSVAARPSP